MAEFYLNQQDYIIFLEGLVHIALGVMFYFALEKDRNQRLPWVWLAWFSLFHGLEEWAVVISITWPEFVLLHWARIILMTLSIISLLKFARTGCSIIHNWLPPCRLMLALVFLPVIIAAYFLEWSNYFLYLIPFTIGGCWAAYVILTECRQKQEKNFPLLVFGVSFIVYFIAVAVGGSHHYLIHSGHITSISDLDLFILGLKSVLSVCLLLSAWQYFGVSNEFIRSLQFKIILLSLCILLAGWLLTEKMGQIADQELRDNLLSQAITAATAIRVDQVLTLSGSEEDNNNHNFHMLRNQLVTIRAAYSKSRFVYLMQYKDGQVIFLADAESPDSKDYSPPGQVYQQSDPKLVNALTKGEAYVEGPYTDEWGTFVTGIAPVGEDRSGKVIAVLGIDVLAEDWPVKIYAYRLASITVTLLVFMSTLFFVLMRLNKLEAQKTAASEVRFRAVFESATEGIIVIEANSPKIVQVNPYVVRWLGYTYEELLAIHTEVLFGQWINQVKYEICQETFQELGKSWEGRCRRYDGSWLDITVTGTRLRYKERDCVLLFTRDISVKKRAEEALRESEERYRLLFNSGNDAAFVYILQENNKPCSIIEVNDITCSMLGYSREELLLMKPEDIDGPVELFWKKLMLDKHILYETVYWTKDGREVPVEVNAHLFELKGRPTVLALARDISERKSIAERLQYLATHDSLTGLPNRYFLEEALKRTIVKSKRGTSSALLFVDIDNFKLINDNYGHSSGDQLLTVLSNLLQQNLGEDGLLARLGGDEFALLLEDVSDQEAVHLAEELLRVVSDSELCLINQNCFNISVSIGVVMIDGTMDSERLLSQADVALFTAKEWGKNRVVLAEPGDEPLNEISNINKMLGQIKGALREDRLVLFFQPVCQISSSQIIHYEALVRMLGPNGEIIPPNSFIPVAERFGLMSQIDRWVMETAIGTIKEHPELKLFINLSGTSLSDEKLLFIIEKKIKDSGINPQNLGFEITETAAVKDLVLAEHWIKRLKSLGCSFALDDFGKGFSSFSYLQVLPVDLIKIDGSYVRNISTNSTHRALVQAMSTVARTLGKKSVAEFVDDQVALEILRSMGVDYGQGYHIGKPAPLDLQQIKCS